MVAAGARTHPLRCFAIRVLSSDSCRRRNIMLFRYRLVAGRTRLKYSSGTFTGQQG